MTVYNAKIHTLDAANAVYENGYITFDERIIQVGDMRDCPTLTDVDYDAQGGTLLPGFVDSHAHVGVWGNAEGGEGDDGNESTDPCTPQVRALDMVNPLDRCFAEAAQGGVTTVLCGPGSTNPIAGQCIALKTAGSPRIDARVFKDNAAMKFAFGENPKMVYRERNESPVTRMGTASLVREQLFKARRYLSDTDKYAANPDDNDRPEFDMKCEALLPVLRREIAVHAHAHRADDIFTAVRIAKEFELRLVIVHATESAAIADELREAGVPAIIGPILCERSKPELAGLSINTGGTLAAKGVDFAIATDHPVVPVQYLPLTAGLAIRGGLAVDKALRAITVDAARLCGIDDRVGSLEHGKDADFVLFAQDEQFYDVLTTPETVFIDGIKV
ncbi:MAG: amidohydrolase family protein [Oscillospiraceae bacterium]|nr:amidohydrolase family protein [Oscillospiraceae bacterium]